MHSSPSGPNGRQPSRPLPRARHVEPCEQLEQRVIMSASMPVELLGAAASAPVQIDTMKGAGLALSSFGNVAGSSIRLDQLRADPRFSTIDGRGFSTVIIDTGIDRDHAFFGPDANHDGVADRIVYQYDFGDNDADASDVNGHGSNVASIAAGNDSVYGGVAPGANIIALKVFTNAGTGTFSMIEKALQWVVNNTTRYNISSVNMSLGDGKNYTSAQKLYGIADELDKLAKQNVKVIAAAGNSYYQFNAQGVSYPAADPNVIGVGAVFSQSGGDYASGSGAKAWGVQADQITPFSQRSTSLTPIFAPGAPMAGANATGGVWAYAGTSQASPVVTGAAALADQLATIVLGRRLTLAEFKSVITSTGTVINDGDNENDNVANTGANFKRLDVKGMAEKIVAMAPQKPAAAPPKASTPAQPAKPAPAPVKKTVNYVRARSDDGGFIASRSAPPASDPVQSQKPTEAPTPAASVAMRPSLSEDTLNLDLSFSPVSTRYTGSTSLLTSTSFTGSLLGAVRPSSGSLLG